MSAERLLIGGPNQGVGNIFKPPYRLKSVEQRADFATHFAGSSTVRADLHAN